MGGVVLHTLSAFLPYTISSFFYPKQREWGGGGAGPSFRSASSVTVRCLYRGCECDCNVMERDCQCIGDVSAEKLLLCPYLPTHR